MRKIVGVRRAHIFSPNSVERDKAIFDAVSERLSEEGFEVVDAEEEGEIPESECYFSMGRKADTLEKLKMREQAGAVVINSAYGIERCARKQLAEIMRTNGIPMPGEEGDSGYWLKRGDAAAQSKDDVVYAATKEELQKEKEKFRRRGITDMIVSANMDGDLVKFYGVNGTGFFRCMYPAESGFSKFGDERRNGMPRHYKYNESELQMTAERLSALVQVPVYGGDCIIGENGEFKIIDFNDWPSFSSFRDEAAEAIATLIKIKYSNE